MELLVGIILILGIGRLLKVTFGKRETDPRVMFGEPMCACYNVPSGSIAVLQAGAMTLKAEVGRTFARFRCGPDLVQVQWDGSIEKMVWRLVGQDGLTAPRKMERQPDGTYLLNWTFSEPTCWCGPEGDHSGPPGHCQAVYRTRERVLEFRILKDARSNRQGLN